MIKTEKRNFGMHPKLLMDTIQRQAGTLQKANLEGVMNAIEAGSPVVRIEFVVKNGIARLSIGDDGRGIESKKEVEDFFETFGTPHTENETTIWKQFRMGRGQMFAFGKNVWRTSTFKMIVDIKKHGLEYELQENLPFVNGCQIDIELYKNPVGYSHNSIESYKECIMEQVKFMEGTILFNGEQINTPASECSWDFEDKNSYYLFNIGADFKIYNLGAFVMKPSPTDMGMMGVAVSKKQLKVNFARNDIQHDCVTYNEMKAVIKKNRIKKTRQNRRNLNTWERIATLKDLRDGGQELKDIQTLSLIPTAQGKCISLNAIRKLKQQWCFAPLGDRYADKLMEREQAVCLNKGILSDLGYTGKKSMFFVWLTGSENAYSYGNTEWDDIGKLFVDFKRLRDGVSDSYNILPNKKYTPTERRIINVIQKMNCWTGRQILLGYSDTASAWTDGSTYICLDRSYLKGKSMSWGRDIGRVLLTMTHEMAHDEDSRRTHIHGPEFYENMVQILQSNNSPLAYCADFKYAMEKSKIEEKRTKELNKIKKAEQKVDAKLGIAAKEKKA